MAVSFDLYLIRHAIAAEPGADWPDDDLRPLTEAGISQFTACVGGLVAIGAVVDAIYTSPLVRARQTADLLAAGLPDRPVVTTLAALGPGHRPSEVMAALRKMTGAVPRVAHRRLALVGHEPLIGELAAHLIGAGRPLPFKKGAVCRIELDALTPPHTGTLIWFIPPKALQPLGR